MSRLALIQSLETALHGIESITRIDSDTVELALAALSDIRVEARRALAEIEALRKAEAEIPNRKELLETVTDLVNASENFNTVPDPEISDDGAGGAWVQTAVYIPAETETETENEDDDPE